LAQLFSAVPEPKPASDIARQRVAVRLRQGSSRPTRLMMTRLIAVGGVVGMGGAAAAQWSAHRWLGVEQHAREPRARVVVEAPPPVRGPGPRVAPVAAPQVEVVEPEPEPVSGGTRSPSSVQPTAPAESSSRLGREAASLERALSALRAGGAARATQALADIDRHLREFPGGALELEARVARVDALLLLGQRQHAERELSHLPLDRVGRKRELRLIRAELRADRDCSAALADFQQLLSEPLPAAWDERALFGRGACLLRSGNQSGAERDFATYLERYPSGRFAAQIRAQIAK
jgi:TolA-binding protein